MAEEKSPNPEAEVAEVKSPSPNPNAGESGTPAESIEHAPSSDEPQATDFPSANAPDPQAANSDVNPNAVGDKPTAVGEKSQTTSQTSVEEPTKTAEDETDRKAAAKKPGAKAAGDKAAAKADGDKPAAKGAKAKKEKAPTVEDKPFKEFIEQDYLPALKSAFAKEGIENVEVNFVKDKIQIPGLSQNGDCWQVRGSWQEGRRQFNVYFPDEDINKQKAFSWATNGAKPSTLESFMIDERKVTLDLLVFYTIQRLNAQKWLAWN
jgi:hypothetical protein